MAIGWEQDDIVVHVLGFTAQQAQWSRVAQFKEHVSNARIVGLIPAGTTFVENV